jgi:dTDP-4-amino-4,6-dideoxygalactose transaminase
VVIEMNQERVIAVPAPVPLVDLRAQYRPLKHEIMTALSSALDDMELFLGPNVRAFEAEFASFCRARFAVGVGSGTDALYLALKACGVRPGDEVITVPYTFFATAEAIRMLDATPVFVDVDPDTYTMDPLRLPAAIGPKTRAIVPVHLYGQMADMDAIMAIARQHGLAVIEDACQAHGAEDRGRRAGSIGDAAAFSFYMSKNLGGYGESGAVTTNSRAVAKAVRILRDHGSQVKYEHQEVGINSRLDELQAAILRTKLPRLDAWNAQRRVHAQTYRQLLQSEQIGLPYVRPGIEHVYHLFVVRLQNRDRVRQELNDRGIGTGVHYPIPIHQQVAFQNGGCRVVGDMAVSERLAREVLSIPMYPELEPDQIASVTACLRESLRS